MTERASCRTTREPFDKETAKGSSIVKTRFVLITTASALLLGACTGSAPKASSTSTPSVSTTPATPSATSSGAVTTPVAWIRPWVVRITSATAHYGLELIDASGHVRI